MIKFTIPDMTIEEEEREPIVVHSLYDFHYKLYPKISRRKLERTSGIKYRWIRWMEERPIGEIEVKDLQKYLGMYNGKLRVSFETKEGEKFVLL